MLEADPRVSGEMITAMRFHDPPNGRIGEGPFLEDRGVGRNIRVERPGQGEERATCATPDPEPLSVLEGIGVEGFIAPVPVSREQAPAEAAAGCRQEGAGAFRRCGHGNERIGR